MSTPGPLMARAWTTFPSLSMSASIWTSPSILACTARSGYLGRRFVEFPRRFHFSTDVQRPARNNRLCNRSGRRRSGRTSALDDAAKQAADLAAGNSASYAASNAGDDIRGGFGRGGRHRNCLRYGNRHGQLGCRRKSLVRHLPGHSRRGGWRRRRGRNQGSGQICDFKLMQIDYLGIEKRHDDHRNHYGRMDTDRDQPLAHGVTMSRK